MLSSLVFGISSPSSVVLGWPWQVGGVVCFTVLNGWKLGVLEAVLFVMVRRIFRDGACERLRWGPLVDRAQLWPIMAGCDLRSCVRMLEIPRLNTAAPGTKRLENTFLGTSAECARRDIRRGYNQAPLAESKEQDVLR